VSDISDMLPLSDLSLISQTPEQIRLKLADENPEIEKKISLNSDEKVSDAIINDAISDGIQNAVEKATENELKKLNQDSALERSEDDELELNDDMIEDETDQQDFDNDDILELINSVETIEKKIDSIVEMMSNFSKIQESFMSDIQSQLTEHSEKVDSMKSDHSANVEKTAHMSRVIEMMNRQEVEGTPPSKDNKKEMTPVSKKSAEELKKDQIKRMFGIMTMKM